MERSFWFPSNFASKQIIFIPHIGDQRLFMTPLNDERAQVAFGLLTNFLPKMKLPQNLLQTFACVASEKKLPTKNGVALKFIANFCLCSIRKKHFLPKMELPQNLLQTFACVASEKNTSYQKWSCLQIYCKLLLV